MFSCGSFQFVMVGVDTGDRGSVIVGGLGLELGRISVCSVERGPGVLLRVRSVVVAAAAEQVKE